MAKKVFKTILSPVGSLLGVFGKDKKKPSTEKGPVVMPLPDDEATKLAKKRSIAAQMQRGGRSSTILSEGSTLGGY